MALAALGLPNTKGNTMNMTPEQQLPVDLRGHQVMVAVPEHLRDYLKNYRWRCRAGENGDIYTLVFRKTVFLSRVVAGLLALPRGEEISAQDPHTFLWNIIQPLGKVAKIGEWWDFREDSLKWKIDLLREQNPASSTGHYRHSDKGRQSNHKDFRRTIAAARRI